ncbi:hypothetical protein H6784_03925 [Candidatus Nomurabacteria bacterium]|nr:hypothetical protein [Candidatus Kaiserbacteria bacterium]MCB9814538.1 hypothetical protein [Candidatus Nomurabacteria bacterium]
MANNLTEQDKEMVISKKYLLYVYLILPALLLIFLVDVFYLDYLIFPYVGIEGLLLPLFVVIFNLPHVIASFFGFLDKEYVSYYRKHLYFYLPVILIGTALLLFVDYKLGLAFYLVNDVWHGIKQKVGIALILGARPGWLHKAWTFLPFFTSSVAYIYFIVPEVLTEKLINYISPSLLISMILLVFVVIAKLKQSAPAVRSYIFLVSALFFLNYLFILNGYIFFAILAFRFVHDFSAFAFYITHDYNRNKDGYKNWFYKMFSSIGLPVLIITPTLAFFIAYLARTVTNGLEIGYSIVILICMTHYYLESVMWKRDSLHRKQIKVSRD